MTKLKQLEYPSEVILLWSCLCHRLWAKYINNSQKVLSSLRSLTGHLRQPYQYLLSGWPMKTDEVRKWPMQISFEQTHSQTYVVSSKLTNHFKSSPLVFVVRPPNPIGGVDPIVLTNHLAFFICVEIFCRLWWSLPQKDWRGPSHIGDVQDFLGQGVSHPTGCKILALVGSPD